mmetsp:Transcript_10533/g.13759  ORF Transcript_10533/g.13759 Transcript_10533/m.13759 type:complete len:164 (+) Transcript_10533:2-493(+)
MLADDDVAPAVFSHVFESGPSGALRVPLYTLGAWVQKVADLLSELGQERIGHELGKDMQPDLTKPIIRCPSCWTYSTTPDQTLQQHKPDCKLHKAVQSYTVGIQPQLQTLSSQIEQLISLIDPINNPADGNSQLEENGNAAEDAATDAPTMPQEGTTPPILDI